MNLFSLAGKVALVVLGASRGIGHRVAVGMAEAGATVICAARTRSQLDEAVAAIETAGGKARAVELDMADLEGMDAALAQCGPIDILFNNVGMNIREPIVEVTEKNYDQIVAFNLKGLYFLGQKVGHQMIERGQGGKIINMGSLTTDHALAKVSVYTTTTGAVGQITKGQASEFGPHNIQVNAIYPGFVLTPRTESLWTGDTMRTWCEGRIALNRLGKLEDLVGTAIFLAAPASDYVTGQCIYVDGGIMAGDEWPVPPKAGGE